MIKKNSVVDGQIINKIKEELLKEFKKFKPTITEADLDLSLQELALDSLDMVEMAMDMEDKFDIRIQDDEICFKTTPNEILEIIKKKLEENGSN